MNDTVTTSTAGQTTTRLTNVAWGVVIAGVVIRLLLQFLKAGNLNSDPDAYVRLSQSLTAGAGFSIEGTTVPTAFRPPLFPILLAVPQWVGLSKIVSIAVVQLATSTMLFIGTFQLAVLMGLRQRGATLAVCMVVCDPLLLYYSSLPMTEVPAAAFLTWAAVSVVQIWQRLSADIFKGVILCGIFAGCCFGFGGLCRPILLVACASVSILLFVWATFRSLSLYLREFRAEKCKLRFRAELGDEHGQKSDQKRAISNHVTFAADPEPMLRPQILNNVKRLIAVSVPAIVAALLLCPWLIRNAVCFQQFIPATTHGGYTLLLGNNPVFYAEVVNQPRQPRWSGDSLNRWNQQLAQDMEAAGLHPADEVGRDRWMYARAKTNIAADESSFRRACVLRLKRFWAVVPIAAAENGVAARALVGIFYSVIGVGLLAQVLLNIKQFFGSVPGPGFSRRFQPWILWSLVFAFVLMHSVYWTNTRMRAPLMPVLIVLAMMSYSAIGRWRFNVPKSGSMSGVERHFCQESS